MLSIISCEFIKILKVFEKTYTRDQQITAYFRDGAAINLFAIFPVIQVFGPRSAVFFWFLTGASVLLERYLNRATSPLTGLSEYFPKRNGRGFRSHFLTIVITTLLVWCLLSLIWSPLPDKGIMVIGVSLLTLISAFVLSREFRNFVVIRFEVVYLAGLISGLLLLGLDLYVFRWAYNVFDSSNELFDLNRNATTFALLIWPAVAILGLHTWGNRLVVLGLISAGFVVLFISEGQAAQLGLSAGLFAGILLFFTRIFYRPIIFSMAIGIVVFPLLMPMVSRISEVIPEQFYKASNVQHRLLIWKGYTALIAEFPLTGWGISADKSLGKQGLAGQFTEQAGFSKITAHPHNFILEIWVNLGAVGAILVSMIFLAIGRIGERFSRLDQAVLAQTMVAWYAISLTGHSFTQSWWITTTGIAGVAVSLVIRHRDSGQSRA